MSKEISFYALPNFHRKEVEIRVTILNYLPLTKEYAAVLDGESIIVDPYINECIPNDKKDLEGEFLMKGEWYLGGGNVFLPSKIEKL